MLIRTVSVLENRDRGEAGKASYCQVKLWVNTWMHEVPSSVTRFFIQKA